MNVKDFKVTTELLDATELDDEEILVANAIYQAYAPVFLEYTMNKGINAVIGLAIGAALRVAKANLSQGLTIASIEDVQALRGQG